MRRGVTLTMSVATAAVIGLGLRAGAQPASSSERPLASSPSAAAGKPPSSRRPARSADRRQPAVKPRPSTVKPPKPTAKQTPASRPSAAVVTVRGDLVSTAYGPVRVQLTVKGGQITAAHAVDHPQGDGQTQQINNYAVPLLDQETLAAQSARIDTVSGATFTSSGYRQSLQSALDAAHRKGAL